jgi:hypothetical protein
MLSSLLDTELKMEKNTGWPKTLGVKVGATMVSLKSREELIIVELDPFVQLLSVRLLLEQSQTRQLVPHRCQFQQSKSAIFQLIFLA